MFSSYLLGTNIDSLRHLKGWKIYVGDNSWTIQNSWIFWSNKKLIIAAYKRDHRPRPAQREGEIYMQIKSRSVEIERMLPVMLWISLNTRNNRGRRRFIRKSVDLSQFACENKGFVGSRFRNFQGRESPLRWKYPGGGAIQNLVSELFRNYIL